MNEWLERHRGYLIVILVNFIGMAGLFFTIRRPSRDVVEILPPPTITPAPTPTPVTLTVYVSGAVVSPDVYSLPAGSRVQQAVQAAGGFARDAAQAAINLAQPLVDGQQVHVPGADEVTASPVALSGALASASSPGAPGGPVNINVASVEELTTLPGIGPALASRIVEYRESQGLFRSVEDLKQVKGIGEATLEKLRDLITVD